MIEDKQPRECALAGALGLRVELLAFTEQDLVPTAGTCAPFDFLRIRLTEKLERKVHLLLIVSEVDLAASTLSYTLALPTPLTTRKAQEHTSHDKHWRFALCMLLHWRNVNPAENTIRPTEAEPVCRRPAHFGGLLGRARRQQGSGAPGAVCR